MVGGYVPQHHVWGDMGGEGDAESVDQLICHSPEEAVAIVIDRFDLEAIMVR